MDGYTAPRLSQGLHASTLCADAPAPWGDASAPLPGREQALDDAAAKLSEEDLYPYDRETATGNGIALQCLHWPPVDVPDPQGPAPLPDVPTVLLAGDKDLSTPMEWASSETRGERTAPQAARADRRRGRRATASRTQARRPESALGGAVRRSVAGSPRVASPR